MNSMLKEALKITNINQQLDDLIIPQFRQMLASLPLPIDFVEHADDLNRFFEGIMDLSLSISEKITMTLKSHLPEISVYEAYVRIGDLAWKRVSELIAIGRIPATNTPNKAEVLTLEPHGFLFGMMSLSQENRKFFIPTFEDILIEEFQNYVDLNKQIQEEANAAWTPNMDPTPPSGQYEIRDDIFQNSGLSEMLRSFQELGEYHPDRDYGGDEHKMALHDKIDDLMTQMFGNPEL